MAARWVMAHNLLLRAPNAAAAVQVELEYFEDVKSSLRDKRVMSSDNLHVTATTSAAARCESPVVEGQTAPVSAAPLEEMELPDQWQCVDDSCHNCFGALCSFGANDGLSRLRL